MSDDKTKVLYIAGWGRSGSTILSNVLGEIDGFFSVGEIFNIWQRGLIENKHCGCGQRFSECEYWTSTFNEAFGGMDQIDAENLLLLTDNVCNPEALLSLLPGGALYLSSKHKKYTSILENLYKAIKITSNSNVIVDTSKIPILAYLLATIPSIDLYIVHLVRDPRAVAYSWMRKKLYDPYHNDPEYMYQFSPFYSSIVWSAWNMEIELFWKSSPNYILLRYEDFIKQPQSKIEKIIKLCDENTSDLPFVSENDVSLHSNHSVSGNPTRLRTGIVHLNLDREWATQMKLVDNVLIKTLFFPFLARYGYIR